MNIAHRMIIAVALVGVAGTLAAQTYPNRPVRFVVAQTIGGNADFVARMFGAHLADRLGQQFVIDNRPGGAGIIGTEIVARAAPDGYTVLLAPTGHGINPALYPKLPFHPLDDFAPISLLAQSSAIVVVPPSLPIKSIKDLIAYAKQQPGKLMFSSSGVASATHLAGELFNSMTGLDLTHVPYKGAPPALLDLVNARVHVMFASPPSALPLIRGNRLRAIATTGTRRSPVLPDLPTVSEAGVPGYENTIWQAMLAPARTPTTVIDRIYKEIADIVRQPELRERLLADGSEAIGSSPKEAHAHIAGEIARWTKVAKAIGLKAQ